MIPKLHNVLRFLRALYYITSLSWLLSRSLFRNVIAWPGIKFIFNGSKNMNVEHEIVVMLMALERDKTVR